MEKGGSKFIAVRCVVEFDELGRVLLIVIEEVHYRLEAGTEFTGGYDRGGDGIGCGVCFDFSVAGT